MSKNIIGNIRKKKINQEKKAKERFFNSFKFGFLKSSINFVLFEKFPVT